MCGTPYDSVNTNVKDVLIPVVGRQKQELPKGLSTISTTPEWNKIYQYVITVPVTTSNVWEWYPEMRVSEENLTKLEEAGEKQRIALAQKLKNQPGKAKKWFNDAASTGVVSKKIVAMGEWTHKLSSQKLEEEKNKLEEENQSENQSKPKPLWVSQSQTR
jgi:hypothetical protein